MARKQSEAVILRTFPIGEQDKIVTLFGREQGLFKGVAKGARKFDNRFGSSLEPMSHVKVFYYEKEGKELVTISNCDLIDSVFELHTELDVSFALGYFAELIEDSHPSRTDDDILFRLLLSSLQALKSGGDIKYLVAYFETWFLRINGFLPDFASCKKCRGKIIPPAWLSPKRDGVMCDRCAPQKKEIISREFTAFISWVKTRPPTSRLQPPFSAEQLQDTRNILKDIIIFHMERVPKSLAYIR